MRIKLHGPADPDDFDLKTASDFLERSGLGTGRPALLTKLFCFTTPAVLMPDELIEGMSASDDGSGWESDQGLEGFESGQEWCDSSDDVEAVHTEIVDTVRDARAEAIAAAHAAAELFELDLEL